MDKLTDREEAWIKVKDALALLAVAVEDLSDALLGIMTGSASLAEALFGRDAVALSDEIHRLRYEAGHITTPDSDEGK